MSFSKNYINVKITPKKRLFQVKGLILDEPLERFRRKGTPKEQSLLNFSKPKLSGKRTEKLHFS